MLKKLFVTAICLTTLWGMFSIFESAANLGETLKNKTVSTLEGVDYENY